MSNLTGIDILLFDVVVQSIGFNPCPDATFVAVTPPIQSLDIFVAVSRRSKCPVASVVYALRMFRIGEPHDDGKDLIAAFRQPWPCDVQSVDVARVDGLDDLPFSPRQVNECYNDVGYNVTWDTTKASFWGNHKKEISRIVKVGGKVISFGWNSGGIGIK